jgi:hypothetical protein
MEGVVTWTEPLRADARDISPRRYAVLLFTGDGQIVANAQVYVDQVNRAGLLHEIHVTDRDGGPRQVRRGMVLIIREALRHAADLGIQEARGIVTPNMRELVAELTGARPRTLGPDLEIFEAPLADARSRSLERSDGDGNL